MILRIWHGWTKPENADEYEKRLLGEIMPAIVERDIPGFRGYQIVRNDDGDETAFITMMRFDAIENVKGFVGEDYEQAHVPDIAREVLSRFDERSSHYEIRENKSF